MFDVTFPGIREATPDRFGRAASIAIAMWRASILVAPVLCLVAAGAAFDMASSVESPAEDILLHPLVVLFSFGMSLLAYMVLSAMAAVAVMALSLVGIAGVLAALPIALVLDGSLARVLRGENARLPVSLLLVGIGGFLTMPFHAAVFPLLGYLALLPLVAFIFLAVAREDLSANVAARSVPVVSGCGKCGAPSQADARFCAKCGAPLETPTAAV